MMICRACAAHEKKQKGPFVMYTLSAAVRFAPRAALWWRNKKPPPRAHCCYVKRRGTRQMARPVKNTRPRPRASGSCRTQCRRRNPERRAPAGKKRARSDPAGSPCRAGSCILLCSATRKSSPRPMDARRRRRAPRANHITHVPRSEADVIHLRSINLFVSCCSLFIRFGLSTIRAAIALH